MDVLLWLVASQKEFRIKCDIFAGYLATTIGKTIGSWSARRLPPSPPPPSPRWTKHSWTPPCRRSDRVKTTRPTRWAQEPAGSAPAPPRTERPRTASWQQTACSTPKPPTTATPATSHQQEQDAPSGKQGRPPGPVPTQPRYRPRAPARGAGPAPSWIWPSWGSVATKRCNSHEARQDPQTSEGETGLPRDERQQTTEGGLSPTPHKETGQQSRDMRAGDRHGSGPRGPRPRAAVRTKANKRPQQPKNLGERRQQQDYTKPAGPRRDTTVQRKKNSLKVQGYTPIARRYLPPHNRQRPSIPSHRFQPRVEGGVKGYVNAPGAVWPWGDLRVGCVLEGATSGLVVFLASASHVDGISFT